MRTWFVSELYYPEETSTGYLLTRLAEGLAGRMPVSALCGQPTYSGRGTKAPVSETRNGVAITRCRSTTFNKDRPIGRLINLITISMSVFVSAVRRFRQGDVVIVVTNPPLLPFLVLAACWLRRAKYVLLVHDVYPDALYVAGILQEGSLAARLGEPFWRWPYRAAERIVVLGRDMRELVSRRFGTPIGKMVLIPNWADHDTIEPRPRAGNALLNELGLTSKWVIQYAGNMGRTHGLKGAVEAAQLVGEVEPAIHFLFIGSGAQFPMVEAAAARSSNITVRGPRPRSDQENFLNACDMALICFGAGMAGVSVPSRMYNVLTAGKPIIAVADANSELAQVVVGDKVGWVVPPDDPVALSHAILAAYRDPETVAQMAARAARAGKKYSLDAAVQGYEDMITDLRPTAGVSARVVPSTPESM